MESSTKRESTAPVISSDADLKDTGTQSRKAPDAPTGAIDPGSQDSSEDNGNTSSEEEEDTDTRRPIVFLPKGFDIMRHLSEEYSYLTNIIQKDFWERQLGRRSVVIMPPKPTPIESCFLEFTRTLGRALMCAQYTPPSQTRLGSEDEFKDFAARIGIEIDSDIPALEGVHGNMLETKRMLLTSATLWEEVWGSSLPAGTSKSLLYDDLMQQISGHAMMRDMDDCILRHTDRAGEIFAYRDSDWKEVMNRDLKDIAWTRWKRYA
ncbi:hypothetical protein V5O48_005832 [Marasmius crinis-equi]|uniref:Uncharacterized protein n=1 Tax=Marasmius crinis-equi TaxID=585013 RepID=A0ABR3FL58_9AGAR